MAFQYNDPEGIAAAGALADGANISSAAQTNQGGYAGTGYDSVAGANKTFETDRGGEWKVTLTAGNASYASKTHNTQTLAHDVCFYIPSAALPSSDARLLTFTSPDGTVLKLEVSNGRLLKLYDLSGLKWTGANQVPVDTWFRVFVACDPGGSGASTLKCSQYQTDATDTAIESYSVTNANCGTNNITGSTIGKINTTPSATISWRRHQWHDGMVTPLGRFNKPVAVSADPPDIVYADYTSLASSVKTYTLTASQVSGTSIGSITVNGLVAEFARPTVDDATIRFTFTDQVGQVTTRDVIYAVNAVPLEYGGGIAVCTGVGGSGFE